MKTTIKLLSAFVLSVGFAACGGEPLAENQTVDENGDVQEVSQALLSGQCQVQSSTSAIETGKCVVGGLLRVTPYCVAGFTGKGSIILNGSFYAASLTWCQ